MKDFKKFIENESLCVISSVGRGGNPQSAIVAFSENENLEIMIGTSKKSRKFQNITNNPNVSIVFGFAGEKSLQYEGTSRFMGEEEMESKLIDHYRKQPSAKKYESDSEQVYMVVSPKWVRLSKSEPVVLGEREF